MGKKLPVGELLRRACVYAESDQLAYLEAISNCKGEGYEEIRADTESFVDQIRKYRQKRWGKTKGDALIDCPTITVAKAMKGIMNEPAA